MDVTFHLKILLNIVKDVTHSIQLITSRKRDSTSLIADSCEPFSHLLSSALAVLLLNAYNSSTLCFSSDISEISRFYIITGRRVVERTWWNIKRTINESCFFVDNASDLYKVKMSSFVRTLFDSLKFPSAWKCCQILFKRWNRTVPGSLKTSLFVILIWYL